MIKKDIRVGALMKKEILEKEELMALIKENEDLYYSIKLYLITSNPFSEDIYNIPSFNIQFILKILQQIQEKDVVDRNIEEWIKEEIDMILDIYQSISLRTTETKELKDLFFDNDFDLDSVKINQIPIEDINSLLFKFYNENLAQKGSTFFSGIRTKKDLFYKTLCWYT